MEFIDAASDNSIRAAVGLNIKNFPISDAQFEAFFRKERNADTPRYKMPIPIKCELIIRDSRCNVKLIRAGVDNYTLVYSTPHSVERFLTKMGFVEQRVSGQRMYVMTPTFAVLVTRPGRFNEIELVHPTTLAPLNRPAGISINSQLLGLVGNAAIHI